MEAPTTGSTDVSPAADNPQLLKLLDESVQLMSTIVAGEHVTCQNTQAQLQSALENLKQQLQGQEMQVERPKTEDGTALQQQQQEDEGCQTLESAFAADQQDEATQTPDSVAAASSASASVLRAPSTVNSSKSTSPTKGADGEPAAAPVALSSLVDAAGEATEATELPAVAAALLAEQQQQQQEGAAGQPAQQQREEDELQPFHSAAAAAAAEAAVSKPLKPSRLGPSRFGSSSSSSDVPAAVEMSGEDLEMAKLMLAFAEEAECKPAHILTELLGFTGADEGDVMAALADAGITPVQCQWWRLYQQRPTMPMC
ncbi:hypothetical protein OEZ86_001353 [Tetradesmus obliquus]|nr:hypothetical protein OEZ86_001353 [Tetradesmus obliquus]